MPNVFREHLDQLANAHGVRVSYLEPDAARGWAARSYPLARPPRVEIPEPITDTAYLIALHEFGHVLGDNGARWGGTPPGGAHNGTSLNAELQAWAWAFQNSRVPLVPRDAGNVLEYIGRLAVRAGARADGTRADGTNLIPGHLRGVYDGSLGAFELIRDGCAHLAEWPAVHDPWAMTPRHA